MGINIVIIGMGNLGRRHLQAVVRLDSVSSIVCHDSVLDALDQASGFCRENGIQDGRIQFESSWSRVLQVINNDTVVIIATTARGRKGILLDTMARAPKAVIAEKPLVQTVEEYKELLRFKDRVSPVYVNVSRRAFADYQALHAYLQEDSCRDISMTFSGGMACWGIHFFDLAVWMCHAKDFRIVFADKGVVKETKRKGFYDCSGTCLVEFDNGVRAYFRSLEGEPVISVTFLGSRGEYQVDELAQRYSYKLGSGERNEFKFEITPVSRLTDRVVQKIIDGKGPGLPDIQEAFLAHRILFEYTRMNGLQEMNFT